MKKIAILTINDNNNYGNRLQNYALQYFLKKIGFKVETINNNNNNLKNNSNIQKIKISMRVFLGKIKRILNGTAKCIKDRKKNFLKFNEKYMNITKYKIDRNNIPEKLEEGFDYFVIGSDQVWNPTFDRVSDIDFGLFASKDKVISYAASFGVDSIEENFRGLYNKGLNNIKDISVREEKGKELVRDLADRESTVVLDPTLLLTSSEWQKVITTPNYIPNEKFILTYFLGNISEERKEKLEKLSKKYNLEIVNLGKIEYSKYFIAGPSEFLWYIKNAEIIFTDSFHACVFSIIFDNPFYILEREDKTQSMNSRIDTLLSKFCLEDRKFKNWNNISLEHDYSHVDEILEKEKEKSLDFLKKALEIKE